MLAYVEYFLRNTAVIKLIIAAKTDMNTLGPATPVNSFPSSMEKYKSTPEMLNFSYSISTVSAGAKMNSTETTARPAAATYIMFERVKYLSIKLPEGSSVTEF